ncbi:hypothetical protein M5K25_022482 [Dendrobium thyrsiflorum]|uniref:Uncharacterized protein n=1 Tax=Dendrobium thyrsiflorum TaxID=117978 RepID=A0ABD0U6D5_DENTH
MKSPKMKRIKKILMIRILQFEKLTSSRSMKPVSFKSYNLNVTARNEYITWWELEELVLTCSFSQQDHSRRATEVGKTLSASDNGQKDCCMATEVGRTVLRGRQWSERPLSGDGGQKDHSRRATVWSERSLSDDEGQKDRSWQATVVGKTVVCQQRSEGLFSASDSGQKGRCLAMEVGRTVFGERHWLERSLSGDGGRKDTSCDNECILEHDVEFCYSVGDGGRKDCSQVTVVGRTVVDGRLRSERSYSCDIGWKDYSLVMEVGRTIVGERQWSERQLSSYGGQKDRTRHARVVRKTIF